MEVFGILSLADVNIVCDRGSNFVCAFKDFQPIFCFGHRLNNVLKISFFQNNKKKKKTKFTNVSTGTAAAEPVASVKAESAANLNNKSSTDESGSSTDDDCNAKTALPVIRRKVTKKLKKPVSPKNDLQLSHEKVTVDQIPASAKLVLVCLNQCKKIVKYVKKVRKMIKYFLRAYFVKYSISFFNYILFFRPGPTTI